MSASNLLVSSHANDVRAHFNNKDMYVLKSCSGYKERDLNRKFSQSNI